MEELVPDTDDTREVIERLGSVPRHIKGDIFEAEDKQSLRVDALRPDIPERKKPTEAQQRAYMHNIRLAQKARKRAA